MIHKYLAGMIDQYQLAGDDQALEIAMKLADWVGWRTGRLAYDEMQMVLQTEFGGLPEALANLYTITGAGAVPGHRAALLPCRSARPAGRRAGHPARAQANVTTPKIIACVRMWEETGSGKYRDIAQNFWDIVTGHHVYVIGGVGNYEHFQAPDVVAAELSNFTCENCVSYNMLKLTRLLHFHQPQRVDMLDYYERTLLNQMLGEQDPASPHCFDCYYTGLSSSAFRRQPLQRLPAGCNPGIYATDWDTFTCDTATGLETAGQVRRHHLQPRRGRYLRQPVHPVAGAVPGPGPAAGDRVPRRSGHPPVRGRRHGHPDAAGPGAEVGSGTAHRPAQRRPAPRPSSPAAWPRAPGWIALRRRWWVLGDLLEVTLPMELAVEPTPGPSDGAGAGLRPRRPSGVDGRDPGSLTPQLEMASIDPDGGARP